MKTNNNKKNPKQKGIQYGILLAAALALLIKNPSVFLENQTGNQAEIAEQAAPVELTRVIDGDTVRIKVNGKESKARLLLIDTPEVSTTKTGSAQKFGEEAKKQLESIVEGKEISIAFDNTHTQEDDYGRLLVYLFAGDRLVQEEMLEEGYARLGYENGEEEYYPLLKKAEQKARGEKKKIWSIPDYVQDYGFSNN